LGLEKSGVVHEALSKLVRLSCSRISVENLGGGGAGNLLSEARFEALDEEVHLILLGHVGDAGELFLKSHDVFFQVSLLA
jgi:hypothetical protein